MHTLLDYDGHLPAYVNITDGRTADNKGAYDITLLKGSVIVADRFYNDFALLNAWESNPVYFVVRHKDSIKFKTIKELELQKTNTITALYKARWEVEIFFRDIKQQLHIKPFIGTSQNAVMIQIWTALITILILKALKKQAKHPWYLSNLVAFIRLNLFVKVDLHKWLDNSFAKEQPPPCKYIQGVLF